MTIYTFNVAHCSFVPSHCLSLVLGTFMFNIKYKGGEQKNMIGGFKRMHFLKQFFGWLSQQKNFVQMEFCKW
jgi:hypothetical protein